MTPQAPWSPTAHAFAHHQFSHVANFWKQGRPASFRLEALPGGHAQLNITFQLPSASEVIPPPFHASPVPAPQRPIHPLFPRGFPQKSGANMSKPASSKKISSRQRKSYRRSVLHQAALAAPSLPPPKNGSLRQAALACVARLQAKPALPVNPQSVRKRPPSSTTPVLSPTNYSPLAQRIRLDFQLGASEVDSPEREDLRSLFPPNNSPLPISPQNVKSFPPPAPLAFTPQMTKYETETHISESKNHCSPKGTYFRDRVESIEEVAVDAEVLQAASVSVAEKNVKGIEESDGTLRKEQLRCCNCDAEMTLDHQCETSDSDGSWEDIESEEDLYPTLDLNSEDWAEKFTESIQTFHRSKP